MKLKSWGEDMKSTFAALLMLSCLYAISCKAAEAPLARMENNPGQNCVSTPEEREGIVKAIELYLQAGKKGDSKIARGGFAPLATMSWTENGVPHTVPIQALYDYFDEKPRDAAGVVSAICVEGASATATLQSRFDDARFTDMFSLIKDGNDWKIVSKIYTIKN